MISMEEAVGKARQVLQEQQRQEPQETPSDLKLKLLEEATNFSCVGTSGWTAWCCSI